MKHKKELIVLSLIAITIIGILSGASYAYFQVQQKQGQETVIESGTMALTLEDGATITADNLIPGEYIEKEFTVKNTGTLKTGYDIYLSEVVNTFVNQSDLVYEIISSNGYNTSNQVQVPNTETKIINNYNINPLEEHKYILKITYKLTNENQNDNMGRTFIAKININEYNQNNSERYIKLYDASNNEIDKQVLTNNSDYYYPLSNINLSNSTNIYCDNGGIPTIENNQLKVSEVTSETNCRISNSINTTITNLPNTKTGIVMTNNQDNVQRMNIVAGKEVILDLNGKEIKSIGVNETSTTYNIDHIVFNVNGKITLNDSVGTGGVYTGKKCRAISLENNSDVIINGGSYNGRQAVYVSGSNANIEINDGNFDSKIYETIDLADSGSHSTITINGGSFTNNNATRAIVKISGYTSDSIITINGGTFNGLYINLFNNNNTGTININGGTFESTTANAIVNYGLLNINQSDKPIYIKSSSDVSDKACVYNSGSNAVLNIVANQADKCTSNSSDTTSGLCVYADTNNDSFAIKTSSYNSKVFIDGGTYISDRRVISSESGTIKIKNAILKSKGGSYGTIYNGDWFVNIGTAVPGTIDVCSSTIQGTLYDLFEQNSSAYITYSNDNVFSNGTNMPDASKVYGTVNATGAACSW